MIYKVWIEIERQPDRGECERHGEPLELRTFTRARDAERFALALHRAHWEDCGGPECAGIRKRKEGGNSGTR